MTQDKRPSDKAKQRLEWVGRIQPFKYLLHLRRRLKIGPKLRIGFGILILLMLVGYGWGIAANNTATEEINRTTNLRAPLALASGQAQANWLKMEADVQAYLALGDQSYRINYEIVRKQFEGNIRELETILTQSQDLESEEYKELSKTLAKIRQNYDAWSELAPQLFELRDDQLRREPALRILIVDAAPYINTIIVETTTIINTQKQQEPSAENLKLISAMYDFRSSFYAMMAGLRGYVTTGRPNFKFEYQANQDVNTQAWKTIQTQKDLLIPSQIESLGKLEAARDAFLLQPGLMFEAVEGPNVRTDLLLFRTQAIPVSDRMLDLLDREVGFQQDLLQAELNTGREQLATAQIITIVSAIIVVLAGLLLAFAIANDIANPILRLTDTAQQIQAGDLAAQAEVATEDEIGILGNAFNAMTSKLRSTLQSLLDYLEQVEVVMAAAAAVDEDKFDPSSLDELVKREDALGQLARVFEKMALEVRAREQRLKRQLQQLQLDIEEKQMAKAETVAVYIPMDRRQAMAQNNTLPEYVQGAALFADVSGFTALTESLANELGLQRGAEEIIRHLNRVYTVLVAEVHGYGGSVISFSGDAITCWFDDLDPMGIQHISASAERAVACALAMQKGMRQFSAITGPDGKVIALSIKVAVAAGPARRFLVGDPKQHQIDVLAGSTLAVLAGTEHEARRGEIVIASNCVPDLEEKFIVSEWREAGKIAVVTGLMRDVDPTPWTELSKDAIPESKAQPWLLPAIFEKVRAGKSDLLSELRPAVALFLKFGGLAYDTETDAGARLDVFIQWVEKVIAQYDGALLQLTVGDKGSYLYIVFGAPIAHNDDITQAVLAALELSALPESLDYITDIQIGLAYGQMRVGAYGGTSQRTYGAIGDKTNLAARLMQAAAPPSASMPDGSRATILCNDSIYEATQEQFEFESLPPILVKGKSQPIAVYRPIRKLREGDIAAVNLLGRTVERALLIDRLSPAEQLTLKVASVIGQIFTFETLSAVYPETNEREHLPKHLKTLIDLDLIIQRSTESASYSFKDPLTHETAYTLMLFAQRRQIHRALAELLEQAASVTPQYAELAHHWQAADDIPKAVHYLEKAGEHAREQGDYEAASRFFNESLALNS
jgi:class 3 adenylate cyclase/HAMP domain-containing protein